MSHRLCPKGECMIFYCRKSLKLYFCIAVIEAKPSQSMTQILKIKQEFITETGGVLPEIEIAFDVLGDLSVDRPLVWVCHALTGNSNPLDWWPGIVGKGKYVDTDQYNVVCANVLGSCYGTTGAHCINPLTGEPYLLDFPLITIRDMVKAHELLRAHLGISKIDLIIGASLGAFQGLEWSYMQPGLISRLVFLVASARTSPWCKAFNEAQRMALEADPTFFTAQPGAGAKGLMAARAMGMVSYRNFQTFALTQPDEENGHVDHFRASTYQRYQGEKLVKRYNAHAYYYISKAFDSHDIGRGRGGVKMALSEIQTHTLCVSTDTDILFPPSEVAEVASLMPNASHVMLQSIYGHDGFLIENDKLTAILENWDGCL
jgi:homoserine O-acetyltransferase/O-succinyltransferase